MMEKLNQAFLNRGMTYQEMDGKTRWAVGRLNPKGFDPPWQPVPDDSPEFLRAIEAGFQGEHPPDCECLHCEEDAVQHMDRCQCELCLLTRPRKPYLSVPFRPALELVSEVKIVFSMLDTILEAGAVMETCRACFPDQVRAGLCTVTVFEPSLRNPSVEKNVKRKVPHSKVATFGEASVAKSMLSKMVGMGEEAQEELPPWWDAAMVKCFALEDEEIVTIIQRPPTGLTVVDHYSKERGARQACLYDHLKPLTAATPPRYFVRQPWQGGVYTNRFNEYFHVMQRNDGWVMSTRRAAGRDTGKLAGLLHEFQNRSLLSFILDNNEFRCDKRTSIQPVSEFFDLGCSGIPHEHNIPWVTVRNALFNLAKLAADSVSIGTAQAKLESALKEEVVDFTLTPNDVAAAHMALRVQAARLRPILREPGGAHEMAMMAALPPLFAD
jgi:hypothetical protein